MEIRQFLGLAGYYRRFIEGFSKIAKLTQKKVKFEWGDKQEAGFSLNCYSRSCAVHQSWHYLKEAKIIIGILHATKKGYWALCLMEREKDDFLMQSLQLKIHEKNYKQHMYLELGCSIDFSISRFGVKTTYMETKCNGDAHLITNVRSLSPVKANVVRWNSKRGPEFTWEREDQFKKKYPHLFTKTAPSSSAAS
ncbi:hypothetical protein Tco_0371182 [Tanacetum coccineum]